MSNTKVTRVAIYRWYDIESMEFPVCGSVLLSGYNKVGKSTILDAVKYALTTSTKFNRAANPNDERTVEDYMRRYVESTPTITGFVSTNIAVEFQKKNGKIFVLGVVVDSPAVKKIEPVWYIIEKPMKDVVFTTNDVVLSCKDFKEMNGIISTNYMATKREARTRIQSKLGIKNMDTYIEKMDLLSGYNAPKKFPELFKAIMKEDPIDITPLTDSMANIKKLIDQIVLIRESLSYLERVSLKADIYVDSLKKYRFGECLCKYNEVKRIARDIEKSKRNIELYSKEIDASEAKCVRLLAEKKSAEEELQAIGPDNEDVRLYNEKKSRLESENNRLFTEIKSIKHEVSSIEDFFAGLERVVEICDKVEVERPSSDFFELGRRIVDTNSVSEEITKLENQFEAARDKLGEMIKTNAEETRILIDEKCQLSRKLSAFETGAVIYPDGVVKLKSAIETEFKKKRIDSPVNILCDLVTNIKEPEWATAIETYLGNKRFAIVVDPKYILTAQEVQRRGSVYNCLVVATNSLTKDEDVDDNSLYSLLEVSSMYAKRYLCRLLNDVTMCEDERDFLNCRRGITKDCFLYSSYATKKIKPETYLCLGAETKKKQVDSIKKDIEKLTGKINRLQEKQMVINRLHGQIKHINVFAVDKYKESFAVYESNRAKIAEIEKDIEDLSRSLNLIELAEKKLRLQKQIEAYRIQINECERIINKRKPQVESENEKIVECDRRGPAKETAYREALEQFNCMDVEIEAEYNKKTKNGTIDFSFEKSLEHFNLQRESDERTVREAMAAYQRKTGSSLPCEAENHNEYRTYYNDIKNVKYEQLQTRMSEEKERTTEYIRNDVINGLRMKFEEIKRTVRAINRNLKEAAAVAGDNEYYHIVLRPSTDVELSGIYKFVTENPDDEMHVIEDDYSKSIDELIDSLINSNAEMTDFQEKICDYRNYYDCDILVCNDVDGSCASLSKKGNTTSGMETQAPFYIITSVCIKMNSSDDTPAFVIIDEAFDKMDDVNTKKTMAFFHSQGIQILMATPPVKVEDLKPYIDELVPVAKDKNNVVLYTDVQYFRRGESESVTIQKSDNERSLG